MNRREFLTVAASLGATIAFDSLTGRPITSRLAQIPNIAIGASEVMQSKWLSAYEGYSDIEIEPYAIQELYIGKLYSAFRRFYKVNSPSSRINHFQLTHILISNSSTPRIEEIPTYRREDLFSVGEALNKEYISGPIGYIKGDYHRGTTNNKGARVVESTMPIRTTTAKALGPSSVVDRFLGFNPEVNRASGGVYIKGNQLLITDKIGLERAIRNGSPLAQLVYYVDDDNEKTVLSQTWSHWGDQRMIGDTSYNWGAYINHYQGNELTTSYLVADKEMVPISFMTKVARGISENGVFKFGLCDAGNGSTMICRQSDVTITGYGVNGLDTHYVPASITFS